MGTKKKIMYIVYVIVQHWHAKDIELRAYVLEAQESKTHEGEQP
jgi:hypothetical protein